MKVNDFINELKRVEKLPTLYKWGTFLNKYNGRYLLSDCSGLIKGVINGYPTNGKYNSVMPDYNANTIISKCKDVSTDFSIISKGEFVWLQGHCGIYIGGGLVIESSPKWENGVQITKLSQRKWKKHGFLPWIDYDDDNTQVSDNTNVSGDLNDAISTIAKYVIKGAYGNGHDKRSSEIYQDIRNLVNGKNGTGITKLDKALKVVANEVKKGTFGNGHEYREKTIYELVRDKVNELCN